MRQNRSRGDLPFPAAPIPSIPAISAPLAVHDVEDRLERWYGELDDWLHIWRKRDAAFYRRLPRIIEQTRLLLQYAAMYLPEASGVIRMPQQRIKLADYHELLGRALSESYGWEEGAEAEREFKQARSLAPEVPMYWHSHTRHLLCCRRMCEALDELNAFEPQLIQAEHGFIAQQILNWALAYSELGFGIRADLVKQCMALVSRAGTGLLVRGCPLPHPPGAKWQRTEILRLLWAGTQGSLPIEELCRREGIETTTYFRWRKRYLPLELGEDPTLI